MSLADTIKRILGFQPPATGSLDKDATHRPVPQKRAEMPRESTDEIEITEDYEKAIALIEAGVPAIFVTGRAGTGKSTFIQFMRRRFQGNFAVVAPTGVAALNAGGVTIHSFFRFPPRIINPEDIKKVVDNRLYKALRILVVDEVSMVRADVLDAMDQFLRLNGLDADLPFGGIQMVMVGDLAQLPPVVSKQEEAVLFSRRYNSPFFFSAQALSDGLLAPIELSRVFRQGDPRFVDILSRIRLGDTSSNILDEINTRAGHILPEPAPITLTPSNQAADEINLRGLSLLDGEEKLFLGEIKGRFKAEEEKLPAPLHLTLKRNARIMFTKNDGQKRWVNGTLGIVRDFSDDKISVEIDERGRGIVDVERVSWDQYRYRYDEEEERVRTEVVGSYVQFPIQPAWAVTIHKAQGKTLPSVSIDLGSGAFAPGQTYVALSRARSLDTIWLQSPIRPEDVFCDKRIAAFYRGLFGAREGGSGFDLPAVIKPQDHVSIEVSDPPTAEGTIADTSSPLAHGLIKAAIEDGATLEITYTDFNGNATTRIIRPRAWVDGDRFTAFCELRQAERDFRITRISSCKPLQ